MDLIFCDGWKRKARFSRQPRTAWSEPPRRMRMGFPIDRRSDLAVPMLAVRRVAGARKDVNREGDSGPMIFITAAENAETVLAEVSTRMPASAIWLSYPSTTSA